MRADGRDDPVPRPPPNAALVEERDVSIQDPDDDGTPELLNPAGREPKQGRSRASFERMLAAATDLLAEHGNDDFALTDVAKRGKVSIGSIYCRFDSKDDLIQAVQRRFTEQLFEEQSAMLDRITTRTDSLDGFVRAFVDDYAELMKRHAPIMRPMMMRASNDPVVRAMGKRSYEDLLQRFSAAVLSHGAEIRHSLPELAVDMAFRTIYAAIARYLGFGMVGESASKADWKNLKTELGVMCSTYLRCADR